MPTASDAPPAPPQPTAPTTFMQLKQFRKEVAELLRQDKQGNARIRVEAVIREHSLLQVRCCTRSAHSPAAPGWRWACHSAGQLAS